MIAQSHPAFARPNRKPALHRLLLTLEEWAERRRQRRALLALVMRSRTSASVPPMPGGKATSQPGNSDQDAPGPLLTAIDGGASDPSSTQRALDGKTPVSSITCLGARHACCVGKAPLFPRKIVLPASWRGLWIAPRTSY
jgi:hypothetical protein